MAAVVTITSPSNVPTAEQEIDSLTRRMGDIVKRLVLSNESLTKRNFVLNEQLHDALDGIEEMRGQLRTKDEIINELQNLVAGKVPQ
jgi:hypothetical protein